MKIRRIGTLAVLALALPGTSARAQGRRVQPAIQLTVEGTSTVRSFRCTATKIEGVVELDSASGALTLPELEGAVRGVEVTIPVAGLDCGNGKMNDHMRKALKADGHPQITYRLTSHDVVSQEEGRGAIRMVGELTIAGTEKAVTMDVNASPAPDGSLRVVGSTEILMSQYGVKAPTLMLGALKVHDKVVVRFDATVPAEGTVAADAR